MLVMFCYRFCIFLCCHTLYFYTVIARPLYYTKGYLLFFFLKKFLWHYLISERYYNTTIGPPPGIAGGAEYKKLPSSGSGRELLLQRVVVRRRSGIKGRRAGTLGRAESSNCPRIRQAASSPNPTVRALKA